MTGMQRYKLVLAFAFICWTLIAMGLGATLVYLIASVAKIVG